MTFTTHRLGHRSADGDRGFTLIEVIVSLVVVGILTSMVVASIAGMSKISTFMAKRTVLVNEMANVEAMFRDDVSKMEQITFGSDPTTGFSTVTPESGDDQCRETTWSLSAPADGFRNISVETMLTSSSSRTEAGAAFCSGEVISDTSIEISDKLTAATAFSYIGSDGLAIASVTDQSTVAAVSLFGSIQTADTAVQLDTLQTTDSLVTALKGTLPATDKVVPFGTRNLE